MRTLTSAVLLLLCAALVVGCGDDGGGSGVAEITTGIENAIADAEGPDQAVYASTEIMLPDPDIVAGMLTDDSESVYGSPALAAGVLAKSGDTLYLAGIDGLWACRGEQFELVSEAPVDASVFADGRHWIAENGTLRTVDGTAEIVTEFAAQITGLAVDRGDIYAGTAGVGVWKLDGNSLVSVSPEWDVLALAATDFGLFAATTDGLRSYRDDRWFRRRLDDTSTDLQTPTALLYRYPYLFVGTDHGLLRYDGGRWAQFDIGVEVTALGWHNARLYIGTDDGTLLTLEGTVLETVVSPEAGAVRSILRFDRRLHVATDDGVFRYRHGHFEQIEVKETTKLEPETEPIASLQ